MTPVQPGVSDSSSPDRDHRASIEAEFELGLIVAPTQRRAGVVVGHLGQHLVLDLLVSGAVRLK